MKSNLMKIAAVLLVTVILLGTFLPAAQASEDDVDRFVARLYTNVLGRSPEPEGASYWADQLRTGAKTGAEVAYGFIFSPEFRGRRLSNEDFVDVLYTTLLDRKSDAAGRSYWVSLLRARHSRMSIFAGFVASSEFNQICESYGIIRGTFTPPEVRVTNPLTGEPLAYDTTGYRPWVVAIGNTGSAMPFHGVADADIVWEFVVESETRILAVYHDVSDVGVIGSVRSARTSSVELARSYDALFVHAGGRAYDDNITITGRPTRFGTVDILDSSLSYRDAHRTNTLGIAAYHSLMTTGELLSQHIWDINIRNELDSAYSFYHYFVQDSTPASGKAANNVSVKFYGNSKTTSFRYSADNKLYYPSQFGGEMIDGNSGETPAFTNILVMQTDMSFRINPTGHTSIRTTGSGSGYFINGGRYIPITWSRADTSSQFVYKLSNGAELPLGVGKTYICMTSTSVTPSFS